MQQRRERARDLPGVADLVGHRVNGRDLDGDGELPALPVQDRPATPGQFDATLLLALRAGAVARALGELKLHETADDRRSPEDEQNGENAQALRADLPHR